MRNEFAKSIIKYSKETPNLCFITGDLGFMALEEVEKELGNHFINGGVAEQNIVSMAASMAYDGFIPFVYSISPFITLRPYEQIRNDACLHDLPVKIVGNGGGYGYGIMGATHHNIEDIGAMKLLPRMKVYLPFFGRDVDDAVRLMLGDKHPNYLRLNMAVKEELVPYQPFSSYRKLKLGSRAIVIGCGTVVEQIFKLPSEVISELEVWLVSTMPLEDFPEALLVSLKTTKRLLVIEEHVKEGGLGESVSYNLIRSSLELIRFDHIYAKGYPSGKYGSQVWHLEENDLAGLGLEQRVKSIIGE
jgi:transketolase